MGLGGGPGRVTRQERVRLSKGGGWWKLGGWESSSAQNQIC